MIRTSETYHCDRCGADLEANELQQVGPVKTLKVTFDIGGDFYPIAHGNWTVLCKACVTEVTAFFTGENT